MNRATFHMFFRLLSGLLLVGMSVNQTAAKSKQPADSVYFRYPMRIEAEMAGSFAELRKNHFHGGLDLRTQQREGIRVYSAAPGVIVRAGVSKTGYGKVLYVQHDNGMQSVYAHLSKFSPKVERLIKKQQRKSRQYETDLRNLHLKTKKNRPIARSGNSGASSGPHLHFEILKDTLRLNPSLHGIHIPDSVPPALLYLALYTRNLPKDTFRAVVVPNPDSLLDFLRMDAPATDYAMERLIRHDHDSLQRLAATHSATLYSKQTPFLSLPHTINGEAFTARYYKASQLPDTLYLRGQTAFGVCALDSMQRMPFHYGLYRLSFVVQTEEKTDTLAAYCLEALCIKTCANINQHLDMPFYGATKKRLEKSYLENAKTSHTPYRVMQNHGFFLPQSGKFHTLIINMEDVCNNKTVLRLPLVCK